MDKVEKLTLLSAWLGEPLRSIEPIIGVSLLSPEEALAGIPDLPEDSADLESHWSYQFFYFLAFGQLALDRCESQQGAAHEIQQFCERSLLANRRARDLAVGLLDLNVEPIIAHLDDVATVLEKRSPGRVQELLGETKLKYALYADRVSIANAVQNKLSKEELRDLFELWIKSPVTIRSALLGAVVEIGSWSKRLTISLYEETEIWGPGDRMNPIKGFVHLDKPNDPVSHWSVK